MDIPFGEESIAVAFGIVIALSVSYSLTRHPYSIIQGVFFTGPALKVLVKGTGPIQ